MPKRLWAVLFLLVACDVSLAVAPTAGDGGTNDGTTDQATTCPMADPGDDAGCALPQGTTCSFGTCGTRIAQCTNGHWIFGSNRAPKPECPIFAPSPGAPCPDCWPATMTCPYAPTSCDPDDGAVPNNTLASCESKVWRLDFLPCRDAGADVQGDAEPDAD